MSQLKADAQGGNHINADSFFNRLIYITVFLILGLLVRKPAD